MAGWSTRMPSTAGPAATPTTFAGARNALLPGRPIARNVERSGWPRRCLHGSHTANPPPTPTTDAAVTRAWQRGEIPTKRGGCSNERKSTHPGRHAEDAMPTVAKSYPQMTESESKRFWARVEPDGIYGCWIWTAGLSEGYGSVGIRGRVYLAHRLSYTNTIGDPGADRQLDHLCRNRPCVNPFHLEPVTHAENIRRAGPPRKEAKTHCKNGHSYSGDNLYLYPDGRRECAICRKRYYAEVYRRNKVRGVQ